MKTDTIAFVLSILALCISVASVIVDIEEDSKSATKLNPTDAQIMESRLYVSDYDNRVKKATNMINSCDRALAKCKRLAYDAYSIEYGSYGNILDSVKAEYTYHKSISIKPLTVEINNVGK